MANRRKFIQDVLIGSGVAAFVGFSHATSLTLKAVELPDEWRFYESNGDILFPIYAWSGGLAAKYICYLKRGRQVIGIEFDVDELETCSPQDIIMKVHEAIRKKEPRHVDFNGGDLGRWP